MFFWLPHKNIMFLSFHNVNEPYYLLKYKNINFIEDESCDKNLFNILKNMFNEYFIYGNFNVAILNNMENLKTFILTKDNKTTKGNSQKTINELINSGNIEKAIDGRNDNL